MPRLILLEASISAFRKTILTLREQPSIHFNIIFSPQLPFGELGAFFLASWDPVFACREHLGASLPHLGSTLGSHFGVSDAPREAILEDHGSSRMDTKLPVTGFWSILELFRDLFMSVFRVQNE